MLNQGVNIQGVSSISRKGVLISPPSESRMLDIVYTRQASALQLSF